MNVKSSTLNPSSAYHFSGNHRLAQKNFLVLMGASASLAFFGIQICCDKNSKDGTPANCYVEQNFTLGTEPGKWSYDEMAHKLIFEYQGKSQETDGFTYRLGNALLKMSDKIDAKLAQKKA